MILRILDLILASMVVSHSEVLKDLCSRLLVFSLVCHELCSRVRYAATA